MLSTPVVSLLHPRHRGRPRWAVFRLSASAIVLIALALSAASARATTTANLYAVPAGGASSGVCPVSEPCTLAAALNLSNATTTFNSDAVVINLATGAYPNADYTIDTSNGAAPASVELLGEGSSPDATLLDGDGGADPTLHVDGIDYPVTVENVSLENANANDGASLDDNATGSEILTLDDDVVSGGGYDDASDTGSQIIVDSATMTVLDTTVEDYPYGIGVDANADSTLDVDDSTVIGNDSGVSAYTGATLTVLQSTVTGNGEWGIWAYDTASAGVVASTISDNAVGVEANGATVGLGEDILASNGPGADCSRVTGGIIVNDSDNVVDDDSCEITPVSTSQVGLLPLANNGGPTQTQRITSSSVAYDGVTSSFVKCAGSDQRGIPYIQGTATDCDAGAYQVAPPTLSAVAPASAEPGGSLTLTGTNLLYATAAFGTGGVPVTAPSLTSLTLGVPVLVTGLQPITVTNVDGSATIAFTVAGPAITSTSLPPGEVDAPYSYAIPVTGGFGPLSWIILAGSLPPGLTLSSAGTISGTPTATFAGTVTVKVTDADDASSTATVSVSVLAPQLKIVSKSVKLARSGAPVKLSCSTAACSGSLSLTVATHIKVKHGHKTVEKSKTTTLANGSYTLAAGTSGTVKLRLTAAGNAVLKSAAKHPLQTTLHATLTGGASATATTKVS